MDALTTAVQKVVEEVQTYQNLDEGIPIEYLIDQTPTLSSQEIKDIAAYIIGEQVDIDESILILAINFVRSPKREEEIEKQFHPSIIADWEDGQREGDDFY
ncbi:MAG TPA: hypothetical protein V6D25_15500 [Leptolyngbyaceae cyanobacterium]